MKFLLYAQISRDTIGAHLGAADYSYYFLLRAFATVLGDLGEVVELDDSAKVDPIYAASIRDGEACVLLSFAPPHKTPLGLVCPTVPVFAWEYPNIPERIEEASWLDDPRNDWRLVLAAAGRAICLSTHTAEAVRRSMGRSYPIAAIPSPLPPPKVPALPDPSVTTDKVLLLNAAVVDTLRMQLDVDGILHPETEDDTPFDPTDLIELPAPPSTTPIGPTVTVTNAEDTADAAEYPGYSPTMPCGWEIPPPAPVRAHLRGVVYTSVLTPAAGRKNWEDLITGFCYAFRDREDATLVLKLAGKQLAHNHLQLLMMLTKLSPFKCRVIAMYGYLADADYASLIAASTYYVNTSRCEGLCLPLVEFLNEGVPAIAPDNTAMRDYIAEDLAFVVKSYPGEPTVWPHGDNEINRTSFHQLDWQSLVAAFRQSYDAARHDPQRYRHMSERARVAIQDYCGNDTVRTALREFLCTDDTSSARVELSNINNGVTS